MWKFNVHIYLCTFREMSGNSFVRQHGRGLTLQCTLVVIIWACDRNKFNPPLINNFNKKKRDCNSYISNPTRELKKNTIWKLLQLKLKKKNNNTTLCFLRYIYIYIYIITIIIIINLANILWHRQADRPTERGETERIFIRRDPIEVSSICL